MKREHIQEIIIILAVLIFFSVIYYIFSDPLVKWISSLNPILVLFITSILSPVYIIFIYFMFRIYGWRGGIAGFLISTASDTISIPHVILMNGQFSTISFNLITDGIFYNLLPNFIKHEIFGISIAVFFVYILIPLALVITALLIVKKGKFKEIFIKSV